MQDFLQASQEGEGTLDELTSSEHPILAFMIALRDCPVPVVAAVSGPAIGIGATSLLHCDLVYADESARLQMPFVPLGLTPEFGASYLMPRRFGMAKAKEWLLLGRVFRAEEAAAMGMVNHVVGESFLHDEALGAALTLAAMPQQALVQTKSLLGDTESAALQQAMMRELELFTQRLQSEEFQQACRAFFER